ncbi:MAG: hypothetical protein QOD99_2927, partial [Chthoniobacter sp.]|nr:hypothetical protein [Chthoniobacter sp.]
IGNHQNKEKIGNIRVLADKNGESLLIIMNSFRWVSAPYTVYWCIRRDGITTRFVQPYGS